MGGVGTIDTVKAAGEVVVLPTSVEEHGQEAVAAVEELQDALAEHHLQLYQSTHPSLTHEHWKQQLGCGEVQEYLKRGVAVLRAVNIVTREVVGYLSYVRRGGVAKVNHLLVKPTERGRGVGSQLFHAFLQRLCVAQSESSEEGGTAWIVAAELNERAIAWYRNLGFVVSNLHLDRQLAGGAICYVTLARKVGDTVVERDMSRLHLFGSEICGEQISIILEGQPVEQTVTVHRYDRDNGLHQLDGGNWVNLSVAYAKGQVRFGRPLHGILGAPVSCATRAARRRAACLGKRKLEDGCQTTVDTPVTPPSRSQRAGLAISSPSKELPPTLPSFGELSKEQPAVAQPRPRRRLRIT
eukprot:TRINITY_DN107134_c0_g1_i1.p1 TRINITY_DN107134_c0_g1~~TRINITY_DN107134_c0_g1_i1.p1  ORF type:complete len:354 (-),score=56.65 TRINITY_DN107134_c0_g1_i1:171-1232(-)